MSVEREKVSEVADKGAHFHRTDLQVHTPRDASWKGQRPKTDAERALYAKEFVAECRRNGLDAVAITDHHDVLFAPLIRDAANEEVDAEGNLYPERERLTVFPGIEVTLALSRQALLILDADFPRDRLPTVLESLAVTPHSAARASLSDVTPLDHIQSLAELHRILDQREWLRGRYIVLPNVTDTGHKTIMRKGMQAEYKEMPCVGGYLDGTVDRIGAGNARIFAGEDPAWGRKAIAVFQTSDSRNATFEDLGRNSTWIKWSEPTAEALRQACLGQQSRISQVRPQLPTVFISRISVSNSRFFGPIELYFNTQYNAIIGGRGTGKSTILDYLRWGLCDQAARANDDDLANPALRRERLIEDTLKAVGGQVEVHFSINEIPHVVRRDAATGEILLKVASSDFAKVREDHVRSLLPVHAYSQKQLSSVALRLDELMRFVTAPIQRALDTVDQKVTELSGRFRENYARVQRARDLEVSMDRQRLAEKSLAEQAFNLRRLLTDLSEDDRGVLDAKPGFDQVREIERSSERDLGEVADSGDALLRSVRRAIRGLENEIDAPESVLVQLRAARESRLVQLRALEKTVEGALSEFDQGRAPGSHAFASREEVRKVVAGFDLLYEEVKQRSTTHQARLDELAQVEDRRRSASEFLQQNDRDLSALGDPEGAHNELRAQIVDLYRERSQLLADECERLTSLSNGLLRASISRGQGLSAVERKFRGFIQGSGVRGGRVDDLFRSLRSESDPLHTWESVLIELEGMGRLEDDAEHTSELTPILSRLDFPVADQRRIRSRITADGWLDLALTPVNDEPLFEYQTKEQEFIAFSAASAGQQATALLRILLSQAGMPLVIDQPEEDLDSQVIQDVVSQIWSAKTRRQLVFASHNANLVVNGDAELVVACAYRKAGDQSGGRIALQGAIDVPEVREEITRVMEGGEKAFRLRKERYGF